MVFRMTHEYIERLANVTNAITNLRRALIVRDMDEEVQDQLAAALNLLPDRDRIAQMRWEADRAMVEDCSTTDEIE